MLDSVLAENVMAVHRQKRSGVLTAVGLTTSMKVAFQDGDPIAIDLGTDKDRLLADILFDCHRVEVDQHRALVEAAEAGESVVELVNQRGWSTADEIGRSLQAVVEDALITFFGSRIQSVSFIDGVQADFDYDRSAVRLRIAADVLLRTTSARIDEQRMLFSEFGDFSGIYGFDEDSSGTGDLSENERRLLDLIDGRTPLSDIARGLRESNITIGRMVHGLVAKRIIRRTGGAQQSTQLAAGASAPTAPMTMPVSMGAESALRSATPTIRNFEPHHTEEPPRSKALLVVLSVILAVLALVGVAVMRYNDQQRELTQVIDNLNELLGRSNWAQATERIQEARTKAGNDLQSLRRVDDLQRLFDAAITVERKAIRGLVTQYDFALARKRLEALPENPANGDLLTELVGAETAFHERADALKVTVTQALEAGNPQAALQRLADHHGHERERVAAQEAIERWRSVQFETAGLPGSPIQRRQQSLEQALAASPSKRQMDQANMIRADIQRQQGRLQEQIRVISSRIDSGDIDGSLAEVERLHLREQVAGTPLEADLVGIIGRTDAIRSAVAAYRTHLAAALVQFDGGVELARVGTEGDDLLKQFGDHGTTSLKALVDLGKDIHSTVGNGSPDAQAASITTMTTGREMSSDLSAAVNTRIERLKTLETNAASLLDSARALVRDGQYQGAETLLKDLVGRVDLRGSATRAAADQELAELAGKIAKRAALQDQLKTILAKGDIAAGTILAREMGLKYLPLSIDSVPTGAEVWHESERIGTTPMILEITAAERVDYSLEFRQAGYEPKRMTGADAEAGWRLLAPLNRAPITTLKFALPTTMQPTSTASGWVTGSRSSLIRVDGDHQWTNLALGDAAVDDPIYAAPVANGTGLLIPTRNLVAVAIDGSTIRRVPLPIGTDLPIGIHRSSVIVDRIAIIVAGLDGVLAAGDPKDARILWRSERGAPFATAPVVIDDQVLTVRRDGTLEVRACDEGGVTSLQRLGDTVVSAWPTSHGIAGATATELFRFDGITIERERLPTPVQAAGDGVLVSTGQRVLVRVGDAWNDLGRIESRLTALPCAWNGHAVLITGHEARVIGVRGFGLTSPTDFLPPLINNGQLILVSQDGTARVYAP